MRGGGHREVSSGGHRWGLCYRRRADKRGYSIRGERWGVSGGVHRTRGRCYRRGTETHVRKVAVNGGYCRGSNRLDHLVQRGGGDRRRRH